MNPLVSIQIPTYNQKQYIKETLDSALAQTYPNIQIIVADDCSTDYNIFEYLKDYQNNPKILIYRNEKNLGRVGNYRNTLYNLVKGDWFVNLDGDDYFTNPEFIQIAIQNINKVKNVVLFQAGAATNKIVEGKIPGKRITEDMFIVFGLDYIKNIQHNLGFTHASLLVNTKMAKDLNYYNFNTLDIDYFSYLRILKEGNIILWREKVYHWRVHENQETYLMNYNRVVEKFGVLEDLKLQYKSIPIHVKEDMLKRMDFAMFAQLSKAFFNEKFSLKRLLFLKKKAGFSSKKWLNLAAHIKKVLINYSSTFSKKTK